jgi:hypothetical protein
MCYELIIEDGIRNMDAVSFYGRNQIEQTHQTCELHLVSVELFFGGA